MDYVLVILILTSAPNFSQSHSHSIVNFQSEELCKEAAANLVKSLTTPGEIKVEVRTSCLLRKDAKK